MTDIALLVAEEFERIRVKDSKNNDGSFDGLHVMDLVSGCSELAQTLKKNIIGKERIQLLKWVMEPKTQIGLAASNEFFSA